MPITGQGVPHTGITRVRLLSRLKSKAPYFHRLCSKVLLPFQGRHLSRCQSTHLRLSCDIVTAALMLCLLLHRGWLVYRYRELAASHTPPQLAGPSHLHRQRANPLRSPCIDVTDPSLLLCVSRGTPQPWLHGSPRMQLRDGTPIDGFSNGSIQLWCVVQAAYLR